MKPYTQNITNVYGKPIAVTSGFISKRKNSNCFKTARDLGFDCFAVAGARAGKRWSDGYQIFFFRGVKPEETPQFRGIIQF